MPKYIKSHSNYRLSTKHQSVKNGTVLERDISTVGGVNSFATGQSTIYSSGNFIMTVNNTTSASRHIVKKGWLPNSENGNIWNTDALKNCTSDINGSKEANIILKNDFLDLRSFACYGSLYSLIQTSIANIINNFPYEIYTGTGSDNFVKHYFSVNVDSTSFDYSGNTNSTGYKATTNFFELSDSGTPATYVSGFSENMYEVLNPGGIDMHTKFVDSNVISNPMKYFANGGCLNYSIFTDTTSENPSDGYDFTWNVMDNVVNMSEGGSIAIMPQAFAVKNFTLNIQNDIRIETIMFNGKNHLIYKDFKAGDIIYCREKDGELILSTKYCPENGDYIATIELTMSVNEVPYTINLYAFRNESLDVAYLVAEKDLFIHIRPKPSLCFYDDFIDNSSMFERCLLGVYSSERNVAKFEILNENEYGTYKTTESMKFPTASGGYNISTNDTAVERYIQNLAKIGLRYDDAYTDNMYRTMTHESLKNFDWTRNFDGNGGDADNAYVENGEKFKSIIRILGYVFDKEKTYIDCIGTSNVITYNDRSNTSDYLFTDALEADGWDVCTIYPHELKEYSKTSGNEIDPVDWSDINQKNNYFNRKFYENTTEIITPYSKDEGGFYLGCNENGESQMFAVPNYSGQTYYVDNGVVKNVIKNYTKDKEYTIPDVSNEFMRRLRINSRNILAKKGTVEGIESLLSLFGFRSRRWFKALDEKRIIRYREEDGKYVSKNYGFEYQYSSNLSKKLPFDFDIVEYTMFTEPIREEWKESKSEYKIDFYNSCKTIPYNTQSYINGEYIPYQGIPVAYRDIDGVWISPSGETNDEKSAYLDRNLEPVKARRLYPYFEGNGIYDGGMYYQMNGGWLNFWPYFYDTNNGLVPNYGSNVSKETLRNIRQVKNINELLSQPVSDLFDGVLYYVSDTSDNYAIIDGDIYDLLDEYDDYGHHYMYFKLPIYGNAVSVGGGLYSDYIKVSDRLSKNGTSVYDLSLYEDGTEIKVYYNNNERPFIIQHVQSLVDDTVDLEPSMTNIFIDGSYHSPADKYTHYFKLTSTYYSDKISDYGWSQLTNTDSEYLRVNTIVDNFNGNNPHSGNLNYDNGYEYVARFDRLFKYASDNGMFDESCFYDINEAYDEINGIGFSGLVSPLYGATDYSAYQHADSKVHSFADKIDTDGNIIKYDLSSSDWISSIVDYNFVSGMTEADGVTSQIINTKVLDIIFYLSNEKFYSKEYQEEVKFIQDKVMPYLEQMVPSTAIVRIKMLPATLNWVFNEDANDSSEFGKVDRWKNYYFWREEAKLGEQFNDYIPNSSI